MANFATPEVHMFTWPNVDLDGLQRHRSGVVRELMTARGCDHLVITGTDNIRYATDFRAQLISEAFDWYAAIIDRDICADLFVPYVDQVVGHPDHARPWLRALRPLPSWAPAMAHPDTWVRLLAAQLRERGARQLGYDGLPAPILHDLQHALPDTRWVCVAADLLNAREIKHPIEITLLQAASQANEAALNGALRSALPGMSDHDLLAEAMRQQQSHGAEFICHSVCNLGKASGSWFADGTRLRPGDAFFLDIGCYGPGGYASDLARTAFLGEPSSRILAAYQHLTRAQEIGQEMAQPGQKVSKIYGAVNRYLDEQGLGGTPYSLGHGVGLRACELPTIYRHDLMDRDSVLRAGQVIALEPETSLVTGDGTRTVLKIEEIFVIEHDGPRRLSPERTLDELVVPLG